MAKVKVRRQSRALHAALRDAGMKKKKAAKVANAFDAYGRDERTQQRRAAGRKGGKATAKAKRSKPKAKGTAKRKGPGRKS
jgi:hypothetical protein